MPEIKITTNNKIIGMKVDWHGTNLFTQSERQAQEASDHECRHRLILSGLAKCTVNFLERTFAMIGHLTIQIETDLLTVLTNGRYKFEKKQVSADNDYLYKIVLGLAKFTGRSVDVVVNQDTVTLTFRVVQDIRYPSRYLEALTRKMSKWAVA